MNVWLITVGEPLPTDGMGDRPYRTGLLAAELTRAGHEVTWWSSTVDHVRKRLRADITTVLDAGERLRLVLLHGPLYRKNVSIARLVNHRVLAREFSRFAPRQERPDAILCSLPTLELCDAATDYGAKRGVPVVLDVRDLWPDIFIDLLPRKGRFLTRHLLTPMFRTVRRACSRATAIVGISPGFVEFGLRHARRDSRPHDRVFAMGYSSVAPSAEARHAAEARWRGFGLDDGRLNVCFFGTMARQFDLDTVIHAARRLEELQTPVRFLLCGDGESHERYQRLAAGLSSVHFPGWVNQAEIWTLMRHCRLGLAPYIESGNFAENLPNKPLEYMSAGLPILSSVRGYLESILAQSGSGITYQPGDAAALADCIAALAADPQRLQAMSRSASMLYEQHFRADTVYPEFARYLEEIAEERRRA